MREFVRVPLARFAACCLLLGTLAALPGCPPPPTVPPVERPAVMPTQGEVAAGFNTRIANLERVWASATTMVEWVDQDGDEHFEQGEGVLIVRLPDHMALSIGKIGVGEVFWAGSDDERYWFFDDQEEKAWVGRHVNVGRPCAKPLPVPLHPLHLPDLIGMTPLPVDSAAADRPAAWDDGRFVLTVPNTAGYGARRVWFDARTFLPTRVEVLDALGEPWLTATLAEHERVEVEGLAPELQPVLATRLTFRLGDDPGRTRITLSRLTADESRFNPRAFNFSFLVKRKFKPEHIVNLDEECERQDRAATTGE